MKLRSLETSGKSDWQKCNWPLLVRCTEASLSGSGSWCVAGVLLTAILSMGDLEYWCPFVFVLQISFISET